VQDVWIRVVGMLLLVIASYYTLAVRSEWRDFFRMSVYLRASVIVFFGAFVLAGLAPAMLLVFGVIDLAAAVWTAMALRAAPSA
jgi:cytochrome c oxidase subunit IV